MDDEMLFKMARKYPAYYDHLLNRFAGGIPYQEYLDAEIEEPWAYGAYIAHQIWNIVQADELDVVAIDKLVKEYTELDPKIGGSANFDLRCLVNELARRAKLKRNQT